MLRNESLKRKNPAFYLLVLSGLSVNAQTDPHVEPPHPSFSSPPLQIRTLASVEEEPARKISVMHEETPRRVTVEQAATVAPHAEGKRASFLEGGAPSERGSRFEVEFHDGRDLAQYLEPPPIKSDSLIDRVLVDPFTPVGVKVGKTTVSCSVITAIKRKNPLCLLNPIVFNVSW